MPVSDVTITQDNIVDSVNIFGVHSPLIFIIDVTYTGAAPTLLCDVTVDGVNPISEDATFQCVYHSDLTPTVRRFMFRADSLLRGFMEDFEDFVQTAEAVSEVFKTKQNFTLVFYDEDETYSDSVAIIAFAARRQFGQTPAISEIYNNQDTLYIAGQDKTVYVYFFNSEADGEDVTITDGTTTYHLATGGKEVILNEDLDTWAGTGNETYPDDWGIESNKSFATTWRFFENPAGVGQMLMTGAVEQDYIMISNQVTTWDKGRDVWLNMQYTTASTYLRIAVLEASLYYFQSGFVFNPVDVYAMSYPIPPAGPGPAGLILECTKLSDHIMFNGPRMAIIVIFANNALDGDLSITNLELYAPTTKNYYRLKVNDLDVDTTYQLKNGATVLATKVVRVKPFCTGSQYLKYLDRNGQYRFFPFNNRYQTKDTPKLIGKINQLVTNIYSDQGDSKNVGYTNERKMTLVADDVDADELDILSDIWNSPRVYLQVGTGDTAADWVRVTVSASDATTRRRKGNSGKVEITVTLPEWYNITML